jgi:hypothetical protein
MNKFTLKFNINNLFGDDHVVHSNLLINLYFVFRWWVKIIKENIANLVRATFLE